MRFWFIIESWHINVFLGVFIKSFGKIYAFQIGNLGGFRWLQIVLEPIEDAHLVIFMEAKIVARDIFVVVWKSTVWPHENWFLWTFVGHVFCNLELSVSNVEPNYIDVLYAIRNWSKSHHEKSYHDENGIYYWKKPPWSTHFLISLHIFQRLSYYLSGGVGIVGECCEAILRLWSCFCIRWRLLSHLFGLWGCIVYMGMPRSACMINQFTKFKSEISRIWSEVDEN